MLDGPHSEVGAAHRCRVKLGAKGGVLRTEALVLRAECDGLGHLLFSVAGPQGRALTAIP